MKHIIFWLAGCCFLGSCNRIDKKIDREHHTRLLGFKSITVAEESDNIAYRKLGLTEKLSLGKIDVQPLRDILYITLPLTVNACGQYNGNIAISRDTIYLHYDLISDEVCASGRVDQLTYLVDNPERRHYNIVFP